MQNLPENKKQIKPEILKKTAEHPGNAERRSLPGGQPQDFQRLKDSVAQR
jgi:hypothetical protein